MQKIYRNGGLKMEKKEIKRIVQRKNVVFLNDHKKAGFKSKKGILIIEYTDDTKTIIDFDCGSDITECDWIRIVNTVFTRDKVLFSNYNYYVRKKYSIISGNEVETEDIGLNEGN